MESYKRYVVSQSKANLTKGRMVRGKKSSHKSSGKLHGSIKGYVDSQNEQEY